MSTIKPLRKVNPPDPDLSRVEKYTHEFTQQLTGNEMLSGRLVRDVVLITGQVNKVEHKLNRALIGWLVTRKNAEADLWDSQADNIFPSRTLDLNCAANVTVDLWVF